MSSGITEIIDTFSVNQLRDLAFAMSSHGLNTAKRVINKDQFVELFKARENDSNLALFAHRIEALTPYKHVFVYSLNGEHFSFSRLKSMVNATFPNLVGSFRKANVDVGELDAQACLADEAQSRIYLKLVHQVQMSGWVSVSRTQKELRQFRKRHLVVITFRPTDGIVTISFPGFTYVQGMQHDERVAYSGIAAEGAKYLKHKLNIDCKPFNAKPAIDALLEEEPGEVTDVKRNVRPKAGGRFGFDAGEEGKLTTALTEFLNKEGDIPVSETQIRSLLRRSGASDIVLAWKRLQIITRVALLHDGPEFLFIWRDSGPSSAVVDSVLQKVISYQKVLAKPELLNARRELLATPFDQVLRPALAAQQYGISRGEVVEILNTAVAKGDFSPRFRVNTDHLLVDYANRWRESPLEFPRAVADDTGTMLDLTVPSNIEVAFQRVR